MEFFANLFGDPVPSGLKLVFLTIGLVLILLLVFWIFRRFVGTPAIKAARGRQPRLAVTDAANLDDKRKLILVRRDDVEHLVMIGGANDILIESNIVRVKPARPQTAQTPVAEPSIVNPDQGDTDNVVLGAVGTGAVIAAAGAVAMQETSETDIAELAIQPEAEMPEPAEEIAVPEIAADVAAVEIPVDNGEIIAAVEAEIPESIVSAEDLVADLAVETVVPEPVVEEPVTMEQPVPVAVEDVIPEPEPEIAAAPPIAPPVIEPTPSVSEPIAPEPSADELHSDALLSLEDALGEELLTVTEVPEVIPEASAPPAPVEVEAKSVVQTPSADEKLDMSDEMQKLLDELAGEKS